MENNDTKQTINDTIDKIDDKLHSVQGSRARYLYMAIGAVIGFIAGWLC